jgi:hypothetical protein
MPDPVSIKLAEIRIDGGTQTRAKISNETVEEYADAVSQGAKFPPVDVFFDGSTNWLADGFHRFHGHRKAGCLDILAIVHTGTLEGALIFALRSNISHGLKRTNDDKRKCVEIALTKFADRSDRVVAEMCGVSHDLVNRMRPQLSENDSSLPTPPRTGADGKSRKAPKKKDTLPPDDAPAFAPATESPNAPTEDPAPLPFTPPEVPASQAMVIAKSVTNQLADIKFDDLFFDNAMSHVEGWIKNRRKDQKQSTQK